MDLSDFTIEELEAEIDRRMSREWPKFTTIEIDYPWENMDTDLIASDLGYDVYNEDVIQDKIRELDLPDVVSFVFKVSRDGSAEIVAVNGMVVSDKEFVREEK